MQVVRRLYLYVMSGITLAVISYAARAALPAGVKIVTDA